MRFFLSNSLLNTSDGRAFEQARIVFGLLLAAYALKSAEISFVGVDPVLLTWALLLGFLMMHFTKKAVISTFFVYAILICFYLLGEMRVQGMGEYSGYVRIFPSFFVLTSIFAVQLSGGSSKSIGLVSFFGKKVEIFSLCAIIYWIVFIAKEQTIVDYAVREYGAANYLTISDILALLSLSVVGDVKKKFGTRVLWLISGLTALMMLGSRASVIIYTLIAVLFISVENQVSGPRMSVKTLFFIAVSISFLAFGFFEIFNDTVTYRMQTLSDLGGDESNAGRRFLLSEYFSTVALDPTCLLISCPPPQGEYAHNIFSVIQYFGIFGIIFIICSLVLLSWATFRGWRPWAASFLAYSILQLLFFRSWTSLVFPMIVAYVIAAALFIFKNQKKFQSVHF